MSTIAELIGAACQAAPSADNTQPCHCDWDGHNLNVRYDTPRVAGQTFAANSPATLLAAGAIIENVAQLANEHDIAINIEYWPEGPEQHEAIARIQLPNNGAISHTADGHYLARHTNRLPYHTRAIESEVVDQLSAMTAGTAGIQVFTDPSAKQQIAHLVKLASQIRFQTREVHEWLGKSLRFSPAQVEQGDGLDIATLGLPPGGGMLLKLISDWPRMDKLNRIGAYRMFAAIDSQPVRVAPAIVAFSADNTADGALDAGRLLCRAWTYINSLGLAAHPYYVITDQMNRLQDGTVPQRLVGLAEAIANESRATFSLDEGQTLYMLLRVGYPKRTARRSQRLDQKRIFTDKTRAQ